VRIFTSAAGASVAQINAKANAITARCMGGLLISRAI
jgi:hypothetical protein